MVTPTFKTVGGGEYDINELKVSGAPDTMANIQVMSADGDWIGQYYWYNEATYEGVTYPAGWFDFNGVEEAEVTLKAGDSVFFYTNQEGAKIQSAGEVASEISLDVSKGFTMVGNATPAALNINNLTVVGAPDTMANIQTMSADGDWIGQYYWYNEFTDTTTGTVYPAGWFDFNGVEEAEVTLNPGEAVFFYTNQTGVKVTMPSAL